MPTENRAAALIRGIVRHKMLLLMLGGAVGTCARYWVGVWFKEQSWSETFPFGTLFINITGSFLLGVIGALILEPVPKPQYEHWYLMLGTGFCGGYTTFSAFSWEMAKLLRSGHTGLAFTYAVSSVVAGVFGVFLALALVNYLRAPGT